MYLDNIDNKKIDDLEEIKEFQSFYTEVEDVKKLLKHNLKD